MPHGSSSSRGTGWLQRENDTQVATRKRLPLRFRRIWGWEQGESRSRADVLRTGGLREQEAFRNSGCSGMAPAEPWNLGTL